MTTEHIKDTLKHKQEVGKKMSFFARDLFDRAVVHDYSKFGEDEMPAFEEVTPALKGLTYGSEEYKSNLAKIRPAIQHHYSVNSHHPEHYPSGISGMNLVDIVEMFCDWYAATKRMNDGDMVKSIYINQERFGMSNELAMIFRNTVEYFESHKEG